VNLKDKSYIGKPFANLLTIRFILKP